MLRDPGTRRLIAGFGLILGTIASFVVALPVIFGDAEWWTLIVLVPVFAVMRKLSELIRTTDPKSRRTETPAEPGSEDRTDVDRRS
jgi:1,4-dihydroxy-2-naphthoate octaprenyltransferase